jgi:hypothetical protein
MPIDVEARLTQFVIDREPRLGQLARRLRLQIEVAVIREKSIALCEEARLLCGATEQVLGAGPAVGRLVRDTQTLNDERCQR